MDSSSSRCRNSFIVLNVWNLLQLLFGLFKFRVGWWRYVKWEKGDDGGIYLIRIVKAEIFREKEEAKHDMIKMCMSMNTMG